MHSMILLIVIVITFLAPAPGWSLLRPTAPAAAPALLLVLESYFASDKELSFFIG